MQRHSVTLFVLAGCVGCISLAEAYQPEIVSSTPRGMQRGTTQKIVIEGVRLADGRQLIVDRGGIEVKSLQALDDKRVEVELYVSAETVPGLYPLRLVTETGLSNVLYFAVGAMPVVDEKEPNNELATAQPIDNNVTIEAAVAREDEDYFVVELKQGQRLTVELEGVRIKKGRSNPFFDPYVAILDAEQSQLASSDDAPLVQQDCLCSIQAPQDGKYFILVRDSSFGGNNDRYRLHVGSFPRPIAVVPAGGQPGEIVDMTFVSISGEAWIEKVQLPSEPADAFPLVMSNDQGVSPSPNLIRVQPIPNVVEQEPNNSFQESTAAVLPGAWCGLIGEPGDVDFFSFDARKDQTLQLKLYARQVLRSELDGVINVSNEKGSRLAGNDDSAGPDSLLEYKIPADGKYQVDISDHLRGGGPGFAYRLEVKLVEPELTLSLPDRRRYEATQINVPQGNRTAVMLNATRRGVAGPIDISGANLPDGVTITPIAMPANRNTVPVLFSAAADAKLDGRLVNLLGRIPDQSIESRFTQQHQLLIGQNNSVVYDYWSDRAAVAVIKALPCTIHVVQPEVPIVRDGSLDLLVKVDRGGLDDDIPIRLLYDPPGIGSNGNIKIAKGQSEAHLPLTANGTAEIGSWPLIVYASVAGNEIATEPVILEVADRIFNFTFPKTSAEVGASATVLVEVETTREFAGTCELELVGLPAGVTCEQPKLEVRNDTEQVAFTVQVDPQARVGQHKSLVARATITDPKGVIRQMQGTGTLQIDEPIAQPRATAGDAAAAQTPQKPLSRLEQLRLMHQQSRQAGD
jgi:hypothetical protein